ncbi:MAG: GNAT family N-acetyltransferase [Chloroflexi bacterium]|nr:GNAT family N-acetyltransferase [Chloroflexota bacterium]
MSLGQPLALEFHPATPDRWEDIEALFGKRGACGGCWCMWWKLKRAEFDRQKGEGNRQALRFLVQSGEVPGILAYAAGRPVAWCAVAPRENYPALERSRSLKRVDDQPVWSISCLFIARPYRRKGVSAELIKAAIAFARQQGATIIEAYPVESQTGEMPDAFAWTGLASTFRKLGFVEAVPRSQSRKIMRYTIPG